ncbi:MAG: hypothetical protein KKC84_04505, partial [Candidatus Omnitrophica bacterium]|nr:hypothetical protein [Candidatus Omnitrophota bacterium]
MLKRLLAASIQQALSPQELARILASLIKEQASMQKEEIAICLSKSDAEQVEKAFLGELQGAAKKAIRLVPREEIRAGFSISYDQGKSSFDFTDKALAEYIGTYLKPKLAQILSPEIKEKT